MSSICEDYTQSGHVYVCEILILLDPNFVRENIEPVALHLVFSTIQ